MADFTQGKTYGTEKKLDLNPDAKTQSILNAVAQENNLPSYESYFTGLPEEQAEIFRRHIADVTQKEGQAAGEKLGYRYAAGLEYAKLMDSSLEDTMNSMDSYNQTMWKNPVDEKGALKAIADYFKLGKNVLASSELGNKLYDAELRGSTKEVEAILNEYRTVQAENETLQDGVPRNLFVEALKNAAQTVPYTAAVAIPSVIGGALGGAAGAVALGGAAGYGITFGNDYIEFRNAGFDKELAGKLASASSIAETVIEQAVGNIAEAGVTAAGKKIFSKKIVNRVLGKIGGKSAFMGIVKAGAGKVGETVVSAGGEALEEGLQSLANQIAYEVGGALQDEGVEIPSWSDFVKDAAEEMKGAFMGSLILGPSQQLLASGVSKALKPKDYQDVMEQASTIESKTMFEEAVKDSKIFEGLSEEERKKAVDSIWESAEARREADIAESMDVSIDAEGNPVDETGERVGKAAEFRTEEGELATEKATGPDGKNYFLVGDTSRTHSLEADGNRYGYIEYSEDDKTVTINQFKMTSGRENIAKEFYQNFAENFAGKKIVWNPKQETNLNLRNEIINENPRGKKAGLDYFENAEVVSTRKADLKIARQIKAAIPSMTTEQVGASLSLVKAVAKAQGMTTDQLLQTFDKKQIVTNEKTAGVIKGEQQLEGQFILGAHELNKAGKAIIYVAKNGDMNTFVHEFAHHTETFLTPEQRNTVMQELGFDSWNRETSEQFADGLIKYMRTGKAQTKGLQAIFEKVAQIIGNAIRGFQDTVQLSKKLMETYEELMKDDGSGLSQAMKIAEEADAKLSKSQKKDAETKADTKTSEEENQEVASQATDEARDEKGLEGTKEDIIKNAETVKEAAEALNKKAEEVIQDVNSSTEEKAQAAADASGADYVDNITGYDLFQTIGIEAALNNAEPNTKEALQKIIDSALAEKEKLEKWGKSEEEVEARLRDKYGIVKSNGVWKFDIDTANWKIKKPTQLKEIMSNIVFPEQKVTMKLDEILDAPALYNLIPKIKDTEVQFTRGSTELSALVDVKGNMISINLQRIAGLTGPDSIIAVLSQKVEQMLQKENGENTAAFTEYMIEVYKDKKNLQQVESLKKQLLENPAYKAELEAKNKFGEGSLFQIIGEKGALELDRVNEVHTLEDNRNVAKEMEEAGKDAKTIRLATGWEKGIDGKWKYEIDDSKFVFDIEDKAAEWKANNPRYKELLDKLHKYYMVSAAEDYDGSYDLTADEISELDKLTDELNDRIRWHEEAKNDPANVIRMKDILYAPELFDAYPEIKRIKVNFDFEPGLFTTTLGSYSKQNEEINLNIAEYDENLKSVLLHELQHVIQRIEGFAVGGNPNMFEATGGKPSEFQQVLMLLDDIPMDELKNYKEHEEFKTIQEYLPSVLEINFDGLGTLTDIVDRWLRDVENGVRSIDSIYDEIQYARKAYNKYNKLGEFADDKSPYEKYQSLSGEVEARNVQARIGLSAEERLNTLLRDTEDIDMDQQIILYQTLAAEAAVETSAQERAVREEYENTENWMKAPNGEKSNLTEKQWVQVRTANFKKWFGDWENDSQNASKVVDENGEPKVVYHGSPYFFEEFDFEKLGVSSRQDNASRGFYFLSNVEAAKKYGKYYKNNMEELKKSKAARNLYEKALSLIKDDKDYIKETKFIGFKNGKPESEYSYWKGSERKENLKKLWEEAPWAAYSTKDKSLRSEILNILEEEDKGNYKNYLRRADKINKDFVSLDNNVYECFLNIRNPVTSNAYAEIDAQHDGLIVKDIVMNIGAAINNPGENFRTDLYIASKDSSQIKSASNNNGNFDESNPDILFQTAYHGTSANFEKFDLNYGLSGEGSMSFGYGVYLTNDKAIAVDYAQRQAESKSLKDLAEGMLIHIESGTRTFEEEKQYAIERYRKGVENGTPMARKLSKLRLDFVESLKSIYDLKKAVDLTGKRHLYTTTIPDGKYLYWDKDIKMEEAKKIAKGFRKYCNEHGVKIREEIFEEDPSEWTYNSDEITGETLYSVLKVAINNPNSIKVVSEYLNSIGYVGVDYPAGLIYGNGNGARNYVIFDENDVIITDNTLFQTEKEMFDHASTFDSWEAYKADVEGYREVFGNDDNVNHVPVKASDQWYKDTWEQAKAIAKRNTYDDDFVQDVRGEASEETESLKDKQWYDEISSNEDMLLEFVRALSYNAFAEHKEAPADYEEQQQWENEKRLRDRFFKEIGGALSKAALVARRYGPGEKIELDDKTIKAIKTMLNNNKRDFRDLYADFTGDSEWAISEGMTTNDKIAVRIGVPVEETYAYTPKEKQAIIDRLDFEDLKKEIKDGSLEMDDDRLFKLMNGYEADIRKLEKKIEALKKQEEEDAVLNVKQTAEIERLYQEKLEKQARQEQLKNIRDIKVRLVKDINRKVDFKTINYDEGRKIIAIQALWEDRLSKYVNNFINQEGAYIRDAYSLYKTDFNYRARLQALSARDADLGGKGSRNLSKVIKLFETKTFDKWTEDERQFVAEHLPLTNWIKELGLEQLSKERKGALQMELQSEEVQNLLKEALPEEMLSLLSQKEIKNWTLEQMEDLVAVVNNIRKEGREKLQVKNEARLQAAEAIRSRIEAALKDSGIAINADDDDKTKEKKQKKIDAFNKKVLGIGNPIKGTLEASKSRQNFLNRLLHGYSDANVRRVARILDNGKEGANTTLLYYRENECYNQEQKMMRQRSQRIERAVKENDIKLSELFEKVTVNFADGSAEFTVDELLYFAAASLDDNSREAVACGNMYDDTVKSQYRGSEELQEQYQNMAYARYDKVLEAAEALPEKFKKLSEAIQKDYGEQYERMNKISIDEFNSPVWRVQHYVPLIRLESNGDTNANRVKQDLLGSMGGTGSNWVDKGMTKKRVEISPANQKPVETGLYSTWADSLKRTEHFIAYASYVRELNRVYMNRDSGKIKQLMQNRYGDGISSYINNYINEVANPDAGAAKTDFDRIIHALRGKTAPAYLSWKMSGIIKQACTSPWPFMAHVSPAEYAGAAFDLARNYKETCDAIKSKSEFMNARRFDPIADLLEEQKAKARNKFAAGLNNFETLGMQGLEWIDWACVAPGWLAVYRKEYARLSSDKEQNALVEERRKQLQKFEDVEGLDWLEAQAQRARLSEDEIERRAVLKADDITRLCQPSNRLTDLAPMFKQRGPGSEVARTILQFTTSLNVIWQNIRYDLPEYARAREFEKVIGTIAGYTLAGIAMGLVTEGLGGDDDDDDENTELRKLLWFSTTQFTDAVPLVGSVMSNYSKWAITGEKPYNFGMSDLFPLLTKTGSGIQKASQDKWDKAIDDWAYAAGLGIGLPVSGIKELKAAAGIGDDDGELEFKPEAFIGRR